MCTRLILCPCLLFALLGLKVADTDESARQEIVCRVSCYFINYFTRRLICNVRIIKTPFTVHWSVSTLVVHWLLVWKSHSNNIGQIINWKNILLTICLCLLLEIFYIFFSCLCVCGLSRCFTCLHSLVFSQYKLTWGHFGGSEGWRGREQISYRCQKKKKTQN